MDLKSEIPIYCAYDELVNIDDLKLRPNNPNMHPDNQIDILAEIISQGWRAPVTVSKLTGLVTRGHGRILAARKIPTQLVPVDYQDYESESIEWADVISDNAIANYSELNMDEIAKIADNFCFEDLELDMSWLDGFDDESYGDTSTDRDGQGVNSTWDQVRSTDRLPVIFGSIEFKLDREIVERVMHLLQKNFDDGKQYSITFSEILEAGLSNENIDN